MALSYDFSVSDQLISKIVLEASVVIWRVLKPLVFEPRTEEMWMRVATEFEVMWDLKHLIVECTFTDRTGMDEFLDRTPQDLMDILRDPSSAVGAVRELPAQNPHLRFSAGFPRLKATSLKEARQS